MKENDLKLDVVTYTTLMKALIRVEKYEKEKACRTCWRTFNFISQRREVII
ncbi:hypothetical protein ACS0TY_027009 [Phlomoides rotata]